MVVETDHPTAGRVRSLGSGVKVTGRGFDTEEMPAPDRPSRPAPLLGEHTRDVARELLGLSDDEIEALVDEGVIEDPPAEFKIL